MTDARILAEILSAELLLSDQYSRAARFKDPSVKMLTSKFQSQLKSHISVLQGLLKDAAGKPQIDAGKGVFTKIMNAAFGKDLDPAFDAYNTSTNFLLAASVTAPLASSLSVAGLSQLQGADAKKAVAGISSTLAGQSSVLGVLLKLRKLEKVQPYGLTVREFSSQLQELQKTLELLHHGQVAESSPAAASSSRNSTNVSSSKAKVSPSTARDPKQHPEEIAAILMELGFYAPGQQ
ncbi:desiccation-related protein PCC13-62-like [Selaginella moellendorffii]|uniref:desiccation-related protein PCC13-62-like n=1 Tax=Selaginella moellendorffii TaxID=88036 RepID=UPI000D1C3936|nr:desiccation-related protein PCC13-62-like [Selaginella moellendorffii]|eukprot:XP_024523466.1 desiccation-related protein PCC13-62-like [Selaginella moellendorffii]